MPIATFPHEGFTRVIIYRLSISRLRFLSLIYLLRQCFRKNVSIWKPIANYSILTKAVWTNYIILAARIFCGVSYATTKPLRLPEGWRMKRLPWILLAVGSENEISPKCKPPLLSRILLTWSKCLIKSIIYSSHMVSFRVWCVERVVWMSSINTVTCTSIARQRVGKKVHREDRFLAKSSLLGHATIEEAVFSVSAVTSQQWIVIMWHAFSEDPTDRPIGWLDSDHVIFVYCRSMSAPRLYV
jgi:hypothetical protein